jgi:hypothetical protein
VCATDRGGGSAPFGTHYGDGFSPPSRGRNSWNSGELQEAVQLPLTRRRKLDVGFRARLRRVPGCECG